MNSKNFILSPLLWLAICLTLGLAPFSPKPHVWEKLNWVIAGAEGMQTIDWFDLALHGIPWVLLVISLLSKVIANNTSK